MSAVFYRLSVLLVVLLITPSLCAQEVTIFDTLEIGYISSKTNSFKRFTSSSYESYVRKVHDLDSSATFEHKLIYLRQDEQSDVFAVSSIVISPNCHGVAFEFRKEIIGKRSVYLLIF